MRRKPCPANEVRSRRNRTALRIDLLQRNPAPTYRELPELIGTCKKELKILSLLLGRTFPDLACEFARGYLV